MGGRAPGAPPRSANELGCQANGGGGARRARPPRSANGSQLFVVVRSSRRTLH